MKSDLTEEFHKYLKNNEEGYYLGSMIFIEREDKTLEVVDGQQRLITLSLLIYCLYEKSTMKNIKKK